MVTEHTLALVGVWKPVGLKAAVLRLKQPASGRKSEVSTPVQNHTTRGMQEASRRDESGTMSSTCRPLKASSSADKRVQIQNLTFAPAVICQGDEAPAADAAFTVAFTRLIC